MGREALGRVILEIIDFIERGQETLMAASRQAGREAAWLKKRLEELVKVGETGKGRDDWPLPAGATEGSEAGFPDPGPDREYPGPDTGFDAYLGVSEQLSLELEQRLAGKLAEVRLAERLLSRLSMARRCLQENQEQVAASGEGSEMLRIIQAMERERVRIAREIHDGPAQSLAALIMEVDCCLRLLSSRDLDALQDGLYRLEEVARSGLKELRRTISDLRPPVLQRGSLVKSLQHYLRDYQQYHALPVELLLSGNEEMIPPSYHLALFRIVQEGLHNVRKHAGASWVFVKLEIRPDRLQIVIRDNGKGFDPGRLADQGGGFGLAGIRERAELLRGEMRVKTVPGRGTELSVTVPIEKEEK